jgi:hypothetical protein
MVRIINGEIVQDDDPRIKQAEAQQARWARPCGSQRRGSLQTRPTALLAPHAPRRQQQPAPRAPPAAGAGQGQGQGQQPAAGGLGLNDVPLRCAGRAAVYCCVRHAAAPGGWPLSCPPPAARCAQVRAGRERRPAAHRGVRPQGHGRSGDGPGSSLRLRGLVSLLRAPTARHAGALSTG